MCQTTYDAKRRIGACALAGVGGLAACLALTAAIDSHVTKGIAGRSIAPTLRWAKKSLPAIDNLEDYTATLIKHERIGNTLAPKQYLAIKVRHKPFSVYLKVLSPTSLKGQEAIYIEGANNGRMWAHGVGIQEVIGTVLLAPNGPLAMRGQRYPITELGVLNLTKRLIEVGEEDAKHGDCEVKLFKNTKINDRVCTCIQVVHPVREKNFLFHIARVFVDDELIIPIRYSAYDWPKTPDSPPEVIEEYTYVDFKPNVGLTAADFDIHNSEYNFHEGKGSVVAGAARENARRITR